jgi:hypothetical protein
MKTINEPTEKDALVQELESLAIQRPDLILIPILLKIAKRICRLEFSAARHTASHRMLR